MTREPAHHRVPFGRARAIRALRVLVLVVLAGVILGMALSYGRRGKPQTSITMTAAAPPEAQGRVLDQSDRFEIDGTREGRPAFTLVARTVTGFAGDKKLLESVHLTIHEERGGSVDLDGKEGQFDASARRAQLIGDVVATTSDGLSLHTGALFYDSDRDMIFTGDEVAFSLGQIDGRGRGLNYLVAERQVKIPDQVRLLVKGLAGTAPITITAGDLVASPKDNTAVFTENVRMERGGDVLVSHYLKMAFGETRRELREMRAFGDVVATLAPKADGRVSEMTADSLTARFSGPDSAIDEAEASGGCRVTAGPYTSRSRSAFYVGAEDRVELRGDPVVLTARERIAAQEIDLHPDRQTLQARGEVRTVSIPESAPSAPAPVGFGGASAVSFQAAELNADQIAERATYSGGARAWQEGNSLQADEIVVDQKARQMSASGSVMSRWTQRPGASAAPASTPSGRPAVTSITSRSLLFEDAAGVAHYKENVRLTRPDATLTADTMDAFFATKEGRRDLDRILAKGSVAVKRGGSFGTAREAEFHDDTNLLVLKDQAGLAEVVDSATGRSMRGRTLTYDLAGDRILTESEQGGRTWITLAPESKDAPPIDPKTRH